jgi:hypothetical protein
MKIILAIVVTLFAILIMLDFPASFAIDVSIIFGIFAFVARKAFIFFTMPIPKSGNYF